VSPAFLSWNDIKGGMVFIYWLINNAPLACAKPSRKRKVDREEQIKLICQGPVSATGTQPFSQVWAYFILEISIKRILQSDHGTAGAINHFECYLNLFSQKEK
jgi:hypothetical protein